jgi:hypothetical protein
MEASGIDRGRDRDQRHVAAGIDDEMDVELRRGVGAGSQKVIASGRKH